MAQCLSEIRSVPSSRSHNELFEVVAVHLLDNVCTYF